MIIRRRGSKFSIKPPFDEIWLKFWAFAGIWLKNSFTKETTIVQFLHIQIWAFAFSILIYHIFDYVHCRQAQMDSEYRIILNVGGVRHETYKHTLKKIPATRQASFFCFKDIFSDF